MLISLFFFAFVLVSVSSQDENEEPYFACYKYIEDKVDILYIIPDREQLLEFCPDAKQYSDCSVKEALHYNAEEVEYLQFLTSVRSLVYELCDENSDLHKTYAASANCYRSLLDKVPVCLSVGEDLYNQFRESLSDLELSDAEEIDEDGDESQESYMKKQKALCIKESYKTACLGIEILEQCGSKAYDLYSEVLRRTYELERYCWPKENYNFRSTFLDFLTTEKKHENIDVIAQLFDLRKE